MITRPASRLALRIYFFGLLQFLIVTAGLIAMLAVRQRPPFPFDDMIDFVAASMADTGGDRAELAQLIERLRSG